MSESESDESEDDYDGPMRFKVESKLNVKRLLQVNSTPEKNTDSRSQSHY